MSVQINAMQSAPQFGAKPAIVETKTKSTSEDRETQDMTEELKSTFSELEEAIKRVKDRLRKTSEADRAKLKLSEKRLDDYRSELFKVLSGFEKRAERMQEEKREEKG